jgi:hypothetical protein
MKHIFVATVCAFVFGLAALAQTTPGTAQSPQGRDRSAMPETTPSQTSPSQTPGMSNPNTPGDTTSEKKLKGCIASQGDKYVLQDKHGKEISLSGSDLASHVGHTVTVHGTYTNGSDASNGATASTSATASGANSGGGQFLVSKVDMVSDTCTMDKGKNSNKDHTDSGKPSPNRK